MHKKHFHLLLTGIVFSLSGTSALSAGPVYDKTIEVLDVRYQEEIRARSKYMAYAQKALAEEYSNIALLFSALATSEWVHARNFKNLLVDLGAQPREISAAEFDVSTTRENLRHACEVEVEEVDHEYPRIIEHIGSEHHKGAIQNITYAWKAEQQHRDLIDKIHSGTGIFFGVLASKIEKEEVQFFVCQRCGSTLKELPEDKCPICGGPPSQYEEVANMGVQD